MIRRPPRSTLFPLHDALPISVRAAVVGRRLLHGDLVHSLQHVRAGDVYVAAAALPPRRPAVVARSEEHTSELQSHLNLVCRLLLEKKKYKSTLPFYHNPTPPP